MIIEFISINTNLLSLWSRFLFVFKGKTLLSNSIEIMPMAKGFNVLYLWSEVGLFRIIPVFYFTAEAQRSQGALVNLLHFSNFSNFRILLKGRVCFMVAFYQKKLTKYWWVMQLCVNLQFIFLHQKKISMFWVWCPVLMVYVCVYILSILRFMMPQRIFVRVQVSDHFYGNFRT